MSRIQAGDFRSRLREVVEERTDDVQGALEPERHNKRSAFLALAKVFEQQCEVVESKVEVKKHPGGDVIQNPSDEEAGRASSIGGGTRRQLGKAHDGTV